jgi:hypothetical protein
VQVTEQVYQKGKVTIRPLCRWLKVKSGGYSPGIERAVVDFGAEDSFELAAQRLSRHHPVKLCAGTVRKLTLRHAREVAKWQQVKGLLNALPAKGAKQLVAQADGTMLPVVDMHEAEDGRKHRKVRWMEMRLCAVTDVDKVETFYGCDAQSVDSLGQRWSHCAGKAARGLNSRIHVVSDGAQWIANQREICFKTNSTHLIDLYHVMEYLAAAQKAHQPWQNPRRRWLQSQKARLLKGRCEQVISELAAHCETISSEGNQPIRAAWRYLSNHRNQLDYPDALAKELPIGSGLIEGAHRHVLQKRLKQSGAWWKAENLETMAQLRVCRANQQWNLYWEQAA